MLTIHSTDNKIEYTFHGCDHFARVIEPHALLQLCLFLGFLLILIIFRCQKCFLSSHGPICVFGEGFGHSSTQALINGICVPTVVISCSLLLVKLEHCSNKFTLSVVDNGKESEYPPLRVEIPLSVKFSMDPRETLACRDVIELTKTFKCDGTTCKREIELHAGTLSLIHAQHMLKACLRFISTSSESTKVGPIYSTVLSLIFG